MLGRQDLAATVGRLQQQLADLASTQPWPQLQQALADMATLGGRPAAQLLLRQLKALSQGDQEAAVQAAANLLCGAELLGGGDLWEARERLGGRASYVGSSHAADMLPEHLRQHLMHQVGGASCYDSMAGA